MGFFLNYVDLCGHTKSSYIDGQTLVVCNVVEMVWRLRKWLLMSRQKFMYGNSPWVFPRLCFLC